MRPLLLALLLLSACRDWRGRVEPSRADAEPEQVAAGGEPIVQERKGHQVRLTPRATYRITGYAVETSRRLLDEWDFAMPMDLALVWGPVADPEVLRRLEFHLSGRYVSYRYQGAIPGAPAPVLASHISNNHLIPADEEVGRALDGIRIGDLVTLSGRLVDVAISDAAGREVAAMRTSLTRDDVGSGACENVYVEEVQVERP
ncbi:MAG: hypothetical protein HZB56_06820 [Deltaproteobacteria bacterium]|nr:hypothetical protein [Deltaproteobacteria bacterium]